MGLQLIAAAFGEASMQHSYIYRDVTVHVDQVEDENKLTEFRKHTPEEIIRRITELREDK